MNTYKSQSGFTLVELVVVIVVLGILASLAIPRLISLQSEARIAVVDSIVNTTRSGSKLVFAKSSIAGLDGLTSSTIDVNGAAPGGAVGTNFGYPQANAAALSVLFETVPATYSFVGGTTTAGSSSILRVSGRVNCQMSYTSPTVVGGSPVITRLVTGC